MSRKFLPLPLYSPFYYKGNTNYNKASFPCTDNDLHFCNVKYHINSDAPVANIVDMKLHERIQTGLIVCKTLQIVQNNNLNFFYTL